MSSVLDMTLPEKDIKLLTDAAKRVQKARQAESSALFDQEQAIILAYTENKTSLREIATHAGVSHQRIAQILGKYVNEPKEQDAALRQILSDPSILDRVPDYEPEDNDG